MSLSSIEPERYFLAPSSCSPNSALPVLVWRNVLPVPRDEHTAQAFVENHGWDRKGPVWKAVYYRHFHSNVHECYAIISGSSEVLYGLGKFDKTDGHVAEDRDSNLDERGSTEPGLRFMLREGDVIVHPAGTSHSNLSEEGAYAYLSFFPRGAPHWITKHADVPLNANDVRKEMLEIPMPEDPVQGTNGHLVPLWLKAKTTFLA